MKGTQAIVRKLIGILHDKRERHAIASSELLQQDLLWTLAPLSSRGYTYSILLICSTRTRIYNLNFHLQSKSNDLLIAKLI